MSFLLLSEETLTHIYLIIALHFRRAKIADEITRLKEEAEIMNQNNTR